MKLQKKKRQILLIFPVLGKTAHIWGLGQSFFFITFAERIRIQGSSWMEEKPQEFQRLKIGAFGIFDAPSSAHLKCTYIGRIKKPTFVSSPHLVQLFWFPQWYFILLFLVSDNHCLARDLDYNLSTSKFNSFFKLGRKEEGIYSGAPPCSVCKYGLFTENSPRIGCLLSQ